MSLRILQPSSFVFCPLSFVLPIYLKTSYLKMGKLCLPTVMGFGILFAMEKRVKAIANPFRYGQAVSGAQYYDRDAVGESLYRAIAGGASNVVLYAPRRYGKTSLVKKIISRWSEDGFTCLYFDMMKIDSAERFCEKYAAAVYAAENGAEKALRSLGALLSRMRPKFTIGDDGTPGVELDFANRKFSESDLEDVLDLPEKIAGGKRSFVVVFDEFQEIAGMSQSIPMEGGGRGCIQHQKSVRYVLLGSRTHLLKRMFSERSRPFYDSAKMLHLEKPPIDESYEFVKNRFASAGMKIDGGEVEKVLEISQNMRYYVQALCSEIFETALSCGDSEVRKEYVGLAMESLMAMKREQYETVVGSLSGAQRNVLSALAAQPTARFDAKYRRTYGIGPSSTVHGALEKLVDKGYVEKSVNEYYVGDPFFARYLTSSPYEITSGMSSKRAGK